MRARAAETYAKFLRKAHAQDAALDEHRNVKPPPRRSGEEPPPTQATEVDKVVDVMMLELEEMEHRRQQAIKRQKGVQPTPRIVEFAKKAFAREATYRMEVLTEIGSLVLRVYILRSLWTALYAQNAAPINLPLHSMITYATVAMLMSLILEVDGTRLIREKIREGTIATDLMKPISVPLLLLQRRPGPDDPARPPGHPIAALRAVARAHRRALVRDVRGVSCWHLRSATASISF